MVVEVLVVGERLVIDQLDVPGPRVTRQQLLQAWPRRAAHDDHPIEPTAHGAQHRPLDEREPGHGAEARGGGGEYEGSMHGGGLQVS